MPAAGLGEAGALHDIDMERVVADAEYRRRVIHRLRRERRMAEALRVEGAEGLEFAAGEED